MTGLQRIEQAFAVAGRENRAALMPYLTGSYPDPSTFLTDARTLLESADLLEIGLPYSDPLGDGPTIQASSQAVLKQGVTVREVFSQIRELAGLGKPILVMTYYNPVYCHAGGERGFLQALHDSGASGVILPDLPPEEAASLREVAAELGLATVFLIAPTSTPERLRRVTAACSGFVYCVSVTGVTGARSTVSTELPRMLEQAREVTDLPLAVGFGVSDASTARQVAEIADGVVVGSALIAAQSRGDTLDRLARELKEGCSRQ